MSIVDDGDVHSSQCRTLATRAINSIIRSLNQIPSLHDEAKDVTSESAFLCLYAGPEWIQTICIVSRRKMAKAFDIHLDSVHSINSKMFL
jgi:hypothetical protein